TIPTSSRAQPPGSSLPNDNATSGGISRCETARRPGNGPVTVNVNCGGAVRPGPAITYTGWLSAAVATTESVGASSHSAAVAGTLRSIVAISAASAGTECWNVAISAAVAVTPLVMSACQSAASAATLRASVADSAAVACTLSDQPLSLSAAVAGTLRSTVADSAASASTERASVAISAASAG